MLHTTSLLCATVTVPAALAGAASGDEAALLEARLIVHFVLAGGLELALGSPALFLLLLLGGPLLLLLVLVLGLLLLAHPVASRAVAVAVSDTSRSSWMDRRIDRFATNPTLSKRYRGIFHTCGCTDRFMHSS